MKTINKIFAFVMMALVGFSITSCSDDPLETNPYNKSGVNLLAFGPTPALRMTEIRITGTNMDRVSKVIFPHDATVQEAAVERSAFNKSDKENIYVNIPDATVPGHIKIVADGVEIESEGTLTFEEPIEVTAINPTTGIVPGDVITISGDYVYNIASVTFTSDVVVEAADFVSTSRREIQVRVPLEAEAGPVLLSDGADWEIEFETPLEIKTATVSALANAAGQEFTDVIDLEYGDQVIIKGDNLQLVQSMMFPGGIAVDFTLSDDHKTLTTFVPQETKNGAISMVLFSGAALSTPEIAVPLASFKSVSPYEEVNPGDEIHIYGELLDRVQKLILPGGAELAQGEFTQTATEITFIVPEGMSDGPVTLYQHANHSVQTDKIKMHHEGTEIPIWTGSFPIGGWDTGFGALSWGGYDWSEVKAGQILSVYFTPRIDEGEYCQVRLGNGSWEALPSTRAMGNDGNIEMSADDNVVRVTLSEADVDQLQNAGGLVVCGAWFIVEKVTLSAAEVVLWEGEAIADDWSNQPYVLSDAGVELAEAGAKAGQAINFYITPIETDWKLQIVEGHWGPTYGSWCNVGNPDTEDGKFEEYDLEAHGGKITFYLTDEMLEAAFTQGWWGGTFVLNGDNVICTKITLE